MDGQRWNTKDYDISQAHSSFNIKHTGTVNLDQFLHDGSIAFTSHNSASDTQITIKPYMKLARVIVLG